MLLAIGIVIGAAALIIGIMMLAQFAVGSYGARSMKDDPAMSDAAVAKRLAPVAKSVVDPNAPAPAPAPAAAPGAPATAVAAVAIPPAAATECACAIGTNKESADSAVERRRNKAHMKQPRLIFSRRVLWVR